MNSVLIQQQESLGQSWTTYLNRTYGPADGPADRYATLPKSRDLFVVPIASGFRDSCGLWP
jgi:hypothetical protein